MTQLNRIYKHLFKNNSCPCCGSNYNTDRCGIFGNADLSVALSLACKERIEGNPEFSPVSTDDHFTKYRFHFHVNVKERYSGLIERSIEIGVGGSGVGNTFRPGQRGAKQSRSNIDN